MHNLYRKAEWGSVRVWTGSWGSSCSRPVRNIIREAANKASRKSKLNGIYFSATVRRWVILDLAIRGGTFKARGKANNEKEVFLVLCLAQTPAMLKDGWCLAGHGRGLSLSSEHPGPAARPQGQGPAPGAPAAPPGCAVAGLIGRELQRKLLCASAVSSKRL